jgi:hypothetical protein
MKDLKNSNKIGKMGKKETKGEIMHFQKNWI